MNGGNYELETGSKYLIRTAEDDDTIGRFAGYTMIGTESAIVVRMEGDKIRFIPVTQISYMDLLESCGEPEQKSSQPEHLYG
ncbi:MAG: hypothetical protein II855_10545 [Candidatus Methanomethylophilaceae archaeon]|nr:hypothetical protein [Candidatus Methanomethylophilaceae archaeon]